MKPSIEFALKVILLLFMILMNGPSPVLARGFGEYEKVTKESGELFGMEIELAGNRNLGKILSYFDLNPSADSIRNTRMSMTDGQIDAYLTPATLDAILEKLPESKRKELLIGLNINGKIEVQNIEIITNGEISRGASRVVSPSGLILPKGLQPASPAPTNGIVIDESVRRRIEWETLTKRWKALPQITRRNLVDLKSLSSEMLASLVFEKEIDLKDFTLKKNLPPKIAELFGRLTWSFEPNGAIEFRHAKPVSSTDRFHSDRELFSDLAGIRRYVDDPTLPPPNELRFSYHWHASRHGSSLDVLVPLESRRRLLDLTLIGRADSMVSKTSYNYSDILGPVHLANTDHIESRQHAESPRAEFDRIVRWMRSPREKAIAEAQAQIAERSKLLQARILKSINNREYTRDLENEIIALSYADADGAQTLGQTLLPPQKRFYLDNAKRALNAENVIALLPLFEDQGFIHEHIQPLLENVLHSKHDNSLTEFQRIAGKAGIGEAEFNGLIRVHLSATIEKLNMSYNAEAVAEAFLRSRSDSEAFPPIMKLLAKCESSSCLGKASEVFEKLSRHPSRLTAEESAQFNNAVRAKPHFQEIAKEIRDGEYVYSSKVALFRINAGKDEARLLEQLAAFDSVLEAERIKVIAKLVEMNHSFSPGFQLGGSPNLYQFIQKEEWKEIAGRLTNKILMAGPEDAAKLYETARLLKIKIPKALVARKKLESAFGKCSIWFRILATNAAVKSP